MRGRVAAVLLAGGSGIRFGGSVSKVYVPLAGRPVLAHSLAVMQASDVVDDIVVVIRESDRATYDSTVATTLTSKVRAVLPGAASRQGSEWAGIQGVGDHCADVKLVLLHDAARPLVTTDLVTAVVQAVGSGAQGAIPVHSLDLDLVDGVGRAVESQNLVAVQTPQAFGLADLRRVYPQAIADGYQAVDTSQTMQAYSNITVCAVPSSPDNIKITHPGDITRAEGLLGRRTGR